MPFSSSPITIKDGASADKPLIAYNDGTNSAFAHPILDSTGALVNPATLAKQDAIIAEVAKIYQPVVSAAVSFTRPADTLAYTHGDLVANSTTAGSVAPMTIAAARGVNVPGQVVRGVLRKSGTSATNAIFRLHLFRVSPSVANGDNGVFSATLMTNWLGAMDVTTGYVFGNGCAGVCVPVLGHSIPFLPATGTANIFALLEARAAYTPVSGEEFSIELEVF